MNGYTDFSAAPPCELGHVFGDVCRRILYIRQRHGGISPVMLCRIDVKDAFRMIPVHPLNLVTFSANTPSYIFSCDLGGVAAPVVGTL